MCVCVCVCVCACVCVCVCVSEKIRLGISSEYDSHEKSNPIFSEKKNNNKTAKLVLECRLMQICSVL